MTYVLIELLLLTTPDPDLARRVGATCAASASAAEEALPYLARDARVELFATSELVLELGEPAVFFTDRRVSLVVAEGEDEAGRPTLDFQYAPDSTVRFG